MGYYTDWENTVRLPTLIEDDLAIPVKVGDVTTLYRLYPAIGYGGTKGIAVKVEESDLLGFMNVFLDATEADSKYIVEAKVIPTETYPIDKAPFRVNWAPNYDFVINVGNITTYTITGLTPGETYFITATAYNIAGYESDFATEIIYTIPSI